MSLEIQDVVPFSVDEFLTDYRVVSSNGSGTAKVFVSMLPAQYIKRILKALQASGVDPICVSNPPSVLAAAYNLAPNYFKPNSAIVWADNGVYSILVTFGGESKYAKTIDPEV
ncbi:MAG: hypothetical protein D6808_02525 [Candidatus Dadabacteria bacterium]|nr:MAG: hypothetical protein D6808_02525 [Candidatus Dadabacteria bacterium]